MKIPLEFHIMRKLGLLNSLYYADGSVTISDLARTLETSESTIKSDLVKYGLVEDDGVIKMDLDKDTRLKLQDSMMEESLLAKVFFLILLDSGKQALYYSNHLAISRANFYKQIIQLNTTLSEYGAKIAVNDGYHIFAEDEKQFRFFIFFYAISTMTEINETLIELRDPMLKIIGKNKLKMLFTDHSEIWEDTYQALLLAIIIIRQSHPMTSIHIEDDERNMKLVKLTKGELATLQHVLPDISRESVVEGIILYRGMLLESKMKVSRKQIKKILDGYVKVSGLSIEAAYLKQNSDTLANLLSVSVYLSQHFPYDINGLSITVFEFYREYSLINDEVLMHYHQFIDVTTKIIGVDVSNMEKLLFYWFVMNVGDFVFVPQKKILFLIRHRHMHLTYTANRLIELLKMFKIDPELVVINRSEYRTELQSGQYDLVLSDTKVVGGDIPVLHYPFSNGILLTSTILSYFKNE